MIRTPAHKQTDPAKMPGQVRNPAPVKAAEYKPTHGGYPDYVKKVPCYMDHGNQWVGFDFDRTLATYHRWAGPAELGEPIKPMVDLLKAMHEQAECRIYTARVWPLIHYDPQSLSYTWDPRAHAMPIELRTERIAGALAATKAIREWCIKHIGFQLAITNVKDIHCIRLYDDIARQVQPNTGIVVQAHSLD